MKVPVVETNEFILYLEEDHGFTFIHCKVYLNGALISNRSTLNNDLASESSTDSYSTVMKKNIGNLYINPFKHFEELNREYQNTQLSEITESDDITRDVPLKMADLTYFNFFKQKWTENYFVNIGPGAKWGLELIYEKKLSNKEQLEKINANVIKEIAKYFISFDL